MRRSTDRRRRITWQHLADHQPIKQLSNRGQVLLDRWFCAGVLLDVGCDDNRLDVPQLVDAAFVAPIKELMNGFGVCKPCIAIADCGRKKLKEPAASLRAGACDRRRKGIDSKLAELARRVLDQVGRRHAASHAPRTAKSTSVLETALPAAVALHKFLYDAATGQGIQRKFNALAGRLTYRDSGLVQVTLVEACHRLRGDATRLIRDAALLEI